MPWRDKMDDVPFEGIYRRQIDLARHDAHTVVGWLEDESHHFGVTIVHDGARIREVRAAAPRHPWTTCPGAAEPLRALVGLPLMPRCGAVGAIVDMRMHCTHLLDLASLAIAHAHAGREHRRYHGTIEPLAGSVPGRRCATLRCDGQTVLRWELDDDRILSPAPHAGRTIYHGFRQWTERLGVAEAEYALVLRRVAFVSNGRRIRIEHLGNAAELGQDAVCHSFRPGVREVAVPIQNSRRRYDDGEDSMLALVATRP